MNETASIGARTFRLALLAFVLAFLLFGPAWGQARFLVSAYHHGGL